MLDLRESHKLALDKNSRGSNLILGARYSAFLSPALSRKSARSSDACYSINILGVGGVGSNLFSQINNFSFSLARPFYEFRLYDFDDIEIHNLNRTYAFNLYDIGKTKISAISNKHFQVEFDFQKSLTKSIDEVCTKYKTFVGAKIFDVSNKSLTNPVNDNSVNYFRNIKNCVTNHFQHSYLSILNEVIRPNCVFNNITIPTIDQDDVLRSMFTTSKIPVIIDCRDTLDINTINKYTWIKLAYNGGNSLAIHFNPEKYMKFMLNTGEGAYEVVPSFYVPASLLASFPLYMLNFKDLTSINPLNNNSREEIPFGQVFINLSETLNESSIDLEELF